MAANHERVALASFITGSVLAGGNAVGVRFSNRELAPLWGAGLALLGRRSVLVAVMALLRSRPPRGRALTGALLYGVFNFGGALPLPTTGSSRSMPGSVRRCWRWCRWRRCWWPGAAPGAPPGRGGRWDAACPCRDRGDVADAVAGSVPLLSLFALVASALCFAEAAVLVRRFPRVHPVAMNAVGMAAGGRCWSSGRCSPVSRSSCPDAPRRGLRSAIWSLLARWWCSCSTSWCSDTGARHERRTPSCSSRWSPWCCPGGWTMNRSVPVWCSVVSWSWRGSMSARYVPCRWRPPSGGPVAGRGRPPEAAARRSALRV